MSLHTLYYPSHVLGNLSKQRALYKARINPVLAAVPPSSVILQTDESDNKPDSEKISGSVSINSRNFLLTQHNTVGIIGGVSADSTLNFVKKLVKLNSEGEEDGLPFVLCSDPALNKVLLSHERNSFSSTRKNEILELDHTAIVENLRRKRIFLERSGARCIVMPCHVSHSWHDEVSKGCSVPVLHMGKCVAEELKEAKLKPLEAGSALRIGVLATNATLRAGFYQDKLQKEGFVVVLPDKATMEHAVIPSIEALTRKDIEGARNLLRIALQVLLLRAVNTIILASDDMRELLPRDDPLLKKCIDPMDALARSTVKFSQSAEREYVSKNIPNT